MGGWGDIGAAVGKAVAPQAARTGTLSGMRAVATAARAASVGNAAGRAIQSAPQRSAGTAVGYGLGAPTAQHIAAATGNVAGNSLNAQQSQLNDLVRAGLLRSASKPINPGLSMTAKSGFNPLALALPWTIPAALTGKLLPNAAKDVINMPADLLKGGEQLGGALVHDIVHGNFGPENLIPFVGPFLGGEHGHVLGQTLKGAWDQSVAGHLIRGDPAGALDTLQQHPVYGGLELAGELGAAGRGLGALGRSGLVGKTAARAANTEREPLVVVPGQEGLVQHYSPNIFTKAAQVVGENTGLSKYVRENVPTRVGLKMNPRTGNVQLPVGKLMTRQEKLMNQPIDIQRANARQSAQNAHVDTVKAFRQMSKTAGAAKDILPLVAMRTARTPESLIEDLHYRLQDLHNVEQAHHAAVAQEKVLKANQVQHGIEPTKAELDAINATKLTPKDLKTNQTHQQIIQKSLESPAAHQAAAQLYGGINPATGFDPARGPLASVPNPAFDAPLAEKIKALYERPGSPGEAAAAKEALDRMGPSTLDTPLTSQLGLDANTAVHPYVDRQHAIDAEKARLGLMDPERMKVREGGVFAQEHIPEVHYDKGGTLSARHNNAMQAEADVKTADKALTQANKASRTPTPELRDARRTLREAHLRESAARARLAQTRGYAQGKRGLDPRLTGALYRQLDRHMTKYDAAQDNLAAAERGVRQAEAEHLGHHSDNIAALTDTLDDAKANASDLAEFKDDKTKPGLVFDTPNGPIPLRPDIVDRFLGRQGVEQPAYMSLKANNATMGQRISSRLRLSRPSGNTPRTQYETYRKGTYTPGIKGMLQSQLRDLAQIHQAKFFDDVVSHAGIVGPNHQPFRSLDEFHNFADAYKEQTGIELTPVNARPKAISSDQATKIEGTQDPNVASGKAIQQAQEARLTIDPHSQKEAIIGVPAQQLDRYHTWEAINSKGPGVMGGLNNIFRNSVLPFSAKWVTGNVAEAGLRTALKNHNPADLAIARPGLANRVMDRMTPEARANLEQNTLMGHHMTMADRANFEREMGHSMGDQSAWDATVHAPVAKQVVQGYQGLLHTIYGVNRKLEGAFDKGLLGQQMRQHVQEFMGSWSKAVKMQSDVMEEMLAQHYSNPRLAAEAGQSIRDTLGQYSHFSPGMQRFVQSIAPFAPWYLNAAKFLYHTMPTEHPLVTNTLLATSRANDAQWQQDHAGVPHGNVDSGMPVGDLLSALGLGDGKFLNIGRYTPSGAFTGGPMNYISSMLAPQFAGAIRNLAGQDVFGRDLKGPDGKKVTSEKDLLLQALNSLLGSFGGPTQVLSRVIQEHGDTPYNTSKIWDTQLKPGTHHGPSGVLGGVNRVWNPFFPTYLKNSSGQGSGGKSGPSLTTQPRSGSSLTTNSLTAFHPDDTASLPTDPLSVPQQVPWGQSLFQGLHLTHPIPTQIPPTKGLKLAKPAHENTGKFGRPGYLRYV